VAKFSVDRKEILRLAAPAIIAGVAEPVLSLTDNAVLGNLSDNATMAQSAAGLVGVFISAVIWTLAQTKSSISSIVSQHLGEHKLLRTRPLFTQVVWINIILGLLFFIITSLAAPLIFSAMKADEILSMTVSYYRIRAIGFPFTLATFAIFGLFRGLQNTSWAMGASLVGAGLNIILDFILVYGTDFTPAMGYMGAAYASLTAQIFMFVVALYFLYKRTDYTMSYGIRSRYRRSPLLGRHISLTANFILRTLAINLAMFFSFRLSTSYGIEAIATHSILMNIWLFFSFFSDGFANAGNALGGKLLGLRDTHGLHTLMSKLYKYGIAMACLLMILCFVLYRPIGWMFTQDSAVHEMFRNTFWIVLIMQPINAVAFVLDGVFKGWGEAAYLRNLLWVLTAVVFFPVMYGLDYIGFNLTAIWTAYLLWMVGRAVVLHFKFKAKLKLI